MLNINGKVVWIVTQNVYQTENRVYTEFCGVFKSRKKAEKVARSISKDCYVSSEVIGSMEWASPEPLGSGDSYYPAFEDYKGYR